MNGAAPTSWRPALVLAALLSACAGPSATVQLDPLHVEGLTLDGQTEAVVMEPESLFREAGLAFERGAFERAFVHYRLLLERFPESPWAGPGRFNAGLSLERLERWSEATSYFTAVAESATDGDEIHGARLHLATCMEQLER